MTGEYVWNDRIAALVAGGREIAPVLEEYGQWAVTLYGVESLDADHPYWIEFDRVNEPDWSPHMAGKRWVVWMQFQIALESARRRFARPKARLRFLVLRRDGYRCQLCGATAASGARLEVDHKQAKSRGGSDGEENLWALCWDCNRGKSNLDLS